MNPTGWFQVAWSDQVDVGQVVRMRYFDRDLVAWRAESGKVTVMDAYCEHLGAHLGYGGKVVGENIQCPFHGWQWNDRGRNVCIPYEDRPNLGRRIDTLPTEEVNEAIFVWHDVDRGQPTFDVPDMWADFEEHPLGGGTTREAYYPLNETSKLHHAALEMHPQYVLENGVDFAHFKYVHETPIVPEFTRQDFDGAVSYVDFTITFDARDEGGTIEDINSGVHAINGGLGVAITRSWGMIDNRTMTAITPVDDSTSAVFFTVWIGRKPGDNRDRSDGADRHAQGVIEQFQNDVDIWSHQKYASPAALARGEYEGFTALRAWAEQFYPGDTPATPRRHPGDISVTPPDTSLADRPSGSRAAPRPGSPRSPA
ncbi:aromatic ring-hydroxylating dioxygenase subunit alpha [Nocardioides sp. CBS4Y-1]|uniref:Rieske-type oxygenase n=2 Tax=Nocardioides acrostichi TaxID=2784339 RepID=A0A930UZ90_9ACTN|nr:aromatic ring-hydroxylating dioxygenase subunit alpha [Nocardioides acrostichi]